MLKLKLLHRTGQLTLLPLLVPKARNVMTNIHQCVLEMKYSYAIVCLFLLSKKIPACLNSGAYLSCQYRNSFHEVESVDFLEMLHIFYNVMFINHCAQEYNAPDLFQKLNVICL